MKNLYIPLKSVSLVFFLLLFSSLSLAQDVTADPSSLDFGNLNTGEQATELTFLTNNTSNNWRITGFEITGPDADQFGQSNNPGASFPPGEMAFVEASFTPTTEGTKTATLTVTYGDFGSPAGTIDIPLSGSAGVVLEPVAEVTDVDFGTHDIFVNIADEITLSNTGNTDLVVDAMSGVNEDFSLEAGISFPFTILEGESRTFEVTFTPIARPVTNGPNDGELTQTRGSSIQIETNDPENPTVFASLRGEVLLPQIEVQMNPFEFNAETVGATKTMTVDVQNTADGTLVLSDLYFSNGTSTTNASADFAITDPASLPFNIPGNTTYPVEVEFTPSATGERSAFLRIETVNSDALSSIFTRGFGRESGFSGPASLDFGEEDPDSGFEQVNFTITNTGVADLQLSSGEITGIDASDFTFTSNNNPVTLGQDQSYTTQITFDPSTLGDKTASLTYTSNAPSSPHVIPLTGRAVDAFIELSSTNFTFEDTNLNAEALQQELVITNPESSNINLDISALAITGDASDFSVDASVSLPLSIAPGNSVNIPLNFIPTVQGDRMATLEIVSNDDNSPHTVSLSGLGLEALLQVNRNLIEFQATQIITNTRTELLTISNVGGNTSLNVTNISLSGEDAAAFSVESLSYPISIATNESLTFQVNFAPQTRTLKAAMLSIETDFGNAGVALMGQTKGPKFSKSGDIGFGTLNLSETSTAAASIINAGESDLTIENINLSGTNASDFQIDDLSLPITIAAGESQEVSVTVNPTAGGTRTAALQITSNDAVTENQQLILSASITNRATVSFPDNPFTFPQTDTGDTTFSLIPVTNTGSTSMTIVSTYTFASDNSSIFSVRTYEDGTDIYPLEIAPGETKNLRFQFSPDGSQDSYATTAAVVTDQAEGPTTNFDFLCGGCIPSGYVHKLYTAGGANRAKLAFDEDIDGNDNGFSLPFPDTSIGRTSEHIVTVRNTGTLALEMLGHRSDGEFTVEPLGFEFGDVVEIILQPNETAQYRITFTPEGDLRDTSGNIILVSDITNGVNGFTNHVIQVIGTRVEPEEVAVGGLVFEADRRTLQENGDTWLMQGNVHAGKLEYGGDVLVNTAAMTVTSLEEIDVFINDIPEVGEFGGERVLLQTGMIEQTVDNVDPVLNVGVGAAAASVSTIFTMVGLPLEITRFKLIDETTGGVTTKGIEMGGKLELPPEIFGDNANITIDRLRIDDVDGVNVMGSAQIAPNLKILKTFQLRNASVNFDTFTNSFGGAAEVRVGLLNQYVDIMAEVQIINGGLDTVALSIDVSPALAIPIANTGFSLAGGNGFIRGLQVPPLSIGLGVDIIPTVSPIDLRFNDMTLAYTFGTSLSASGTIQLYRQDIGGGSVSIKANGVSVSAFVNLYNVFKGDASMLVENRNSELFFESTAQMSITIPKAPDCFACGAVNAFLPETVASVDATFNNTEMSGTLTVARVLDLTVELIRQSNGSYDTNFEANLGIINLSFRPSEALRYQNRFYFENDEELMKRTFGKEGQSLVFEAPKNKRGAAAPMDVPFTLDDSFRNIIVRVEGTSGMPDYTLILPDGSEVTPDNAESLGYLASTFEDNKRFYILQNTPIGDYNIRIDDGDTYQFDILGAEFAPELEITSVTQDATTDEVTFTWTDSDLDSDANISFYYDIDAEGGDGNQIVENISENDNTDSFTFNTSELKSGTYFIYGTINDDVENAETSRAPAISYGPQSFTIEREMDIATTTLFGKLDNNIFELSWSPVADAEFYNVYITEGDEEVTLFSDNQNVGDNSSFDFTEIEAGRTYNFAVTANKINLDDTFEESNLSNSITFEYISAEENNLPRVTTESLPDYTDACSEYSQTITMSDVDTEDVLTLSLAIAPENMTLSENTITWRPNVEQLGQNQVVFEVSDGNGGIVQKQLIIVVLEADGNAPVPTVETLADITEDCSATLTAPTAMDDCEGEITATTDDPTTYTEQGDYQVTWTYTDSQGNAIEQIQNVTIADATTPEFVETTLPADTSREADTNNEYVIENFTTGINFTENCSATLAQTPEIGTVLTPGIYDITLTVTDVGDNTDIHTFEVEVIENALGVDEVIAERFSLYPNPTERFIMIGNPGNANISTVEIYNLNGKLVKRLKPQISLNDIEVDTSSLSKGMYLMKINTEEGQTVKSFLKE